MSCRVPREAKLHRMTKSLAFPLRCPGCGYHFRTESNMRDHQRSYEEIDRGKEG